MPVRTTGSRLYQPLKNLHSKSAKFAKYIRRTGNVSSRVGPNRAKQRFFFYQHVARSRATSRGDYRLRHFGMHDSRRFTQSTNGSGCWQTRGSADWERSLAANRGTAASRIPKISSERTCRPGRGGLFSPVPSWISRSDR